ncbi:Undecaprenyl-phosphate N-acetylglucosaminyl 1-phosphate transferase [Vulgatibacter incomptus]|uniref:Undecaprenyl-phosphate N-acetylglucosaminyl 1-phosphate transferase n=1 Tax=Vulgatibacter incomptus TaxID=1391653 RepID=A0A0K1PHV9_9BACT|nr:Undecaprenyl-phosphate N-acetylglucosaminyl 1-phosphate transferase [Vulgatibacter incomptus]
MALRWGFVDHVSSARKIHARPIPRLGGVAIVAAFFTPLLGLLVLESSTGRMFLADQSRALGLFIGGAAIAALGIYDDIRGANAWAKLCIQIPIALLMFQLGFRVEVIANPFGEPITLGWLALPITMMWIIGLINAVNLIDGLDGLAGGVALFAIGVTFIIAVARGQPLMVLFSAALAGAVLGFLFYNFNPATVFMGDTGSMFLGFVLATTSLQVNQKSSTTVALLIPIVALGLPIFDTSLAFSRRMLSGRSPFSADRGHVHHRLLDAGLSHRQAALVLYGCCMVLSVAALTLTVANNVVTAALLASLLVGAVSFARKLGYGFKLDMAGEADSFEANVLMDVSDVSAKNDEITRATG